MKFARMDPSPIWGTGTVLSGRYRLREPIGRGAMGEVWLADHMTLGVEVAVKLVDLASRGDARMALARFQREAHTAAQLKCPNVVKILDHGAEGRVAFIAMELLEGESLEEMLQRRRRIRPERLSVYMAQIAKALDKAHAAGVIHRDIKPSNVFITREDGEEVVKVLDFGLAKLLAPHPDLHIQTQHGVLVGTPAYMSPEQVLGDSLDHRSDLWQLAILAFECICGERPFEGNALGDLYLRICSEPLPLPSRISPVPKGFDEWFARAARRNPRERFQTASELADALARVLAPGRPMVTTSAPGDITANTAFSMAMDPRRSAPPPPPAQSVRRPRDVAFPLAAAPLALIILGTGLLWADFGAERDRLGGSELEASRPPITAAADAVDRALAAPPPPAAAPPPTPASATQSAPATKPRSAPGKRHSAVKRPPPASRSNADDIGF